MRMRNYSTVKHHSTCLSRHLKILKDAGLIRCRKDGTKRMYSLVDPRIQNAIEALTPELVNVLQREVMEQMSCGSKTQG